MISNNNYLKCPKNQLFWQQLNEETKPYFVKTICIAFNLSRYLIFDTSYHWRNISKVEYENKIFFGRHLPTLVRAEQIVVSFVVKKMTTRISWYSFGKIIQHDHWNNVFMFGVFPRNIIHCSGSFEAITFLLTRTKIEKTTNWIPTKIPRKITQKLSR